MKEGPSRGRAVGMDVGDVENLAGALTVNQFEVRWGREVAGEDVLIGRRSDFRWGWFASRLHTFVVMFTDDGLTPQRAEELTAAAQQFAIKHKGGLPRGIQNGTVTLATFLCSSPSTELARWFETEPLHRYAALRLPLLADLDARKLIWFSGRMARGYVYQRHLHQIVNDVIASGLKCSA